MNAGVSSFLMASSYTERHAAPLGAPQVAQALSEPNSRRVLALCVRAAVSAKEIGETSGLPVATVYRQIHRLLDLGVLVVERSAMTRDGKKYDLYRSRVKEAQLLLVEDHEEVRWEPNADVEDRLAAMWDAMRITAPHPEPVGPRAVTAAKGFLAPRVARATPRPAGA